MSQKTSLFVRMMTKGLLGFLLLDLLLFGAAGTLRYPGAWVLTGSLGSWMLTLGLVLLAKHPDTLAGRLSAKEGAAAQRGAIALIGLLFLLSFVVAGLDHRFGWSRVPLGVSAAAWVVMLAGYVLYAVVMFQNAYASRVVELQQGQAVIRTGLYGVVRHPMYLAAILLFLAMPLVLGSYPALLPMALFPLALVLRIRHEEAMLLEGLPGYGDYQNEVRYRLIPYLW